MSGRDRLAIKMNELGISFQQYGQCGNEPYVNKSGVDFELDKDLSEDQVKKVPSRTHNTATTTNHQLPPSSTD